MVVDSFKEVRDLKLINAGLLVKILDFTICKERTD